MKLLWKIWATSVSLAAFTFASQAFFENFDGTQPVYFSYGSGGNQKDFTHVSGFESPDEMGTSVLKLELDPDDGAGAWTGPNYTSHQTCHFGRYVARIKTASARGSEQPLAGAVVGFYTYYNDQYDDSGEKDLNQNGIADNSEIDFEWLIADPRLIYMTAYTDYDDENGPRKVNRIVNLATGEILSTTYATSWDDGVALTGEENMPETIPALTGYDASSRFYTYGFDWASDHIRWWIVNPENEQDTVTLWNYRGPKERITQRPASLMLNFWHTNDWPVETVPGSVESPKISFQTQFDWVRFIPESSEAIRKRKIPNEKQEASRFFDLQGRRVTGRQDRPSSAFYR